MSLCDDCLKELLDPADRRYLYPFINCTNCGPRYSITRAVPYDRPNTTMAAFTMCPACQKEYDDPRNRRFHAQPNACPDCGPAVQFGVRQRRVAVRSERRQRQSYCEAAIRSSLKQGGIVAVKGIGGFHIACDASNDEAVKRLRERKRKSNKPFAVMAPSVRAAYSSSVHVSAEEEEYRRIQSPTCCTPFEKRGAFLSKAVSPNNRFVGVMLPYTPLALSFVLSSTFQRDLCPRENRIFPRSS